MLTPEEALRIARGEEIEADRRQRWTGFSRPVTIGGSVAVLLVSLLLAVVGLCIPAAGKLMFCLGIGLVLMAGVWALILSLEDGYTWQASIPLFWIFLALQDPARWGKPVVMHFFGFIVATIGIFLSFGPGVGIFLQGWRPSLGFGGRLERSLVPPVQNQPAPRRKVKEPPSAETIPGLAAYWPLDSATHDDTDNAVFGGEPGRLIGATFVPGVRGKALQFHGAVSRIELHPSPRLSYADGAPFTWAGWVQTTSDGTLLGQRRRTDEDPVVDVTIEQGALCATVRCDGPDLGRAKKISGAQIADGTWHHFALTRDEAGNIELFLDGQSQAKAAGAGGPITTDLNFLGQERYWATLKSGPGHPYFTGLLDECCLFDRVLKPAELRTLAAL